MTSSKVSPPEGFDLPPGPILVTGCAGFIASRVVQLLLDRGRCVVGIDNLNDAYDPALKRHRLAKLQPLAGFSFRPVDICSRREVEKLFDAPTEGPADRQSSNPAPFAAVVNLAARAGVRPSVEDPWIYFQTNCEGALNLLDACRAHGVRKYVLASTSSLYGAHNALPYSEDADTNRPLSPYAASKKAAEAACYSYHHLHGLDVTIFRYFTVFGPAGRPDMSVFRFVRWIAEGEPILVFGDGSQSRDFTYVDDIARGTVAGLRPTGYEIINLGSDSPVELRQVIAWVGELLGAEPQVVCRPAHPADVPATWANVEKARRLLGWRPEVSVREGLARCVEWYKTHREFARLVELNETVRSGSLTHGR
ncbi:MAG: NAD-dependent epimerase/dehydratase family protein [Planctomycetota bacterium]